MKRQTFTSSGFLCIFLNETLQRKGSHGNKMDQDNLRHNEKAWIKGHQGQRLKGNLLTRSFVVRVKLKLLQLGLGLSSGRSEEGHHLLHDGPAAVVQASHLGAEGQSGYPKEVDQE